MSSFYYKKLPFLLNLKLFRIFDLWKCLKSGSFVVVLFLFVGIML